MRRIATWFLSTVTVVVLMFGYHTSTSGVLSTARPPAVTSGSTTSGSGTSSSGSSGSGSSGSGSGSGSRSSGSGSGSGSSGSGANASTKKSASSTVTGNVAQTEWGPVQVQLTVSAGTVTAVSVVQYPNGNPRDSEINGYALPVLIQETLDSQSASIDMVSGATVTSTGYLQSLQSALDEANL